jgi:hypothetical protein
MAFRQIETISSVATALPQEFDGFVKPDSDTVNDR